MCGGRLRAVSRTGKADTVSAASASVTTITFRRVWNLTMGPDDLLEGWSRANCCWFCGREHLHGTRLLPAHHGCERSPQYGCLRATKFAPRCLAMVASDEKGETRHEEILAHGGGRSSFRRPSACG